MASLGGSVPFFRSFAPRLSREFFTCRQCLTQTPNYAAKPAFRRQFGAFSFTPNTANANSTAVYARTKKAFPSAWKRSASGSAAASAIENGAPKPRSGFPDVSNKSVAYWLLGSAASVFGIVVFGGLTRLTESGYVYLCATIDYGGLT